MLIALALAAVLIGCDCLCGEGPAESKRTGDGVKHYVYCGKAYPVVELGCIGYGVYICMGCA